MDSPWEESIVPGPFVHSTEVFTCGQAVWISASAVLPPILGRGGLCSHEGYPCGFVLSQPPLLPLPQSSPVGMRRRETTSYADLQQGQSAQVILNGTIYQAPTRYLNIMRHFLHNHYSSRSHNPHFQQGKNYYSHFKNYHSLQRWLDCPRSSSKELTKLGFEFMSQECPA